MAVQNPSLSLIPGHLLMRPRWGPPPSRWTRRPSSDTGDKSSWSSPATGRCIWRGSLKPLKTMNVGSIFQLSSRVSLNLTTVISRDKFHFTIQFSFKFNSLEKRASRASALRADEFHHLRGLVFTPWTSPTPWTRPGRSPWAKSYLSFDRMPNNFKVHSISFIA